MSVRTSQCSSVMAAAAAHRRAGWVREMYAWCAAVHKNGVALVHDLPPRSKLMAQPPHDATPGEAAILHYTWGTLYHDADGKEFWRFDKRDYTAKDQELKAGLAQRGRGSVACHACCANGQIDQVVANHARAAAAAAALLTGASIQAAAAALAARLEAAGRRARPQGTAHDADGDADGNEQSIRRAAGD